MCLSPTVRRAAPQEASEKCACMRRRSDGVVRELVHSDRAGFWFLAWVRVVAEQGSGFLPGLWWLSREFRFRSLPGLGLGFQG